MSDSNRISICSIYGLVVIGLALAGCSSLAGTPTAGAPRAGAPMSLGNKPANSSQDLYIGNIGGGVPLYSTGKNPHEVGDITDKLPRVTGVWVDQTGDLYAFTDNRQYPYETIEEFKPRGTSPFFSLVLKHYGLIVAADSAQNVYAQGAAVINGQGQQVIDVYPPGSQNYANEYVVPSIGRVSGPQSMAFDTTGALLVGVASIETSKLGAVFRLDRSSSTFVNLNLKKAYGGLIATDAAGNLYVGGATLISVYAPGATSPTRIVHSKQTIVTLTAASNGKLYVDTYTGGITVYPPGKANPSNSFVPQAQVSGLALGPG